MLNLRSHCSDQLTSLSMSSWRACVPQWLNWTVLLCIIGKHYQSALNQRRAHLHKLRIVLGPAPNLAVLRWSLASLLRGCFPLQLAAICLEESHKPNCDPALYIICPQLLFKSFVWHSVKAFWKSKYTISNTLTSSRDLGQSSSDSGKFVWHDLFILYTCWSFEIRPFVFPDYELIILQIWLVKLIGR